MARFAPDPPPAPWLILAEGAGSPSHTQLAWAMAAAPSERIVAAVLEEHSPWWQRTLAVLPADNLVEQPLDRGTATGILVACLRIVARDPSPLVIVATGAVDGAVARLERACTEARQHPDLVIRGPEPGLFVAMGRALLRLFQAAQPAMFGELAAPARLDGHALDRVFPFLPKTDFLRHVVDRAPEHFVALDATVESAVIRGGSVVAAPGRPRA